MPEPWEWDDPDDETPWRGLFGPMPARKPTPPPDNSDRRYVCTRCKKDLTLEVCKRIERVSTAPGEQPLVRIIHACPCTQWVRSTRYPWDDAAMRRLFNGQSPALPWPKVSGAEDKGEVASDPAPVAPGGYKTPDELMVLWAWHLGGVTSAHDFLLWCRGPRDDLADGA
ncbi:MAG: hypothetical protein ACXVGB_00175 [Mycobacteriaceae bacterium]